MDGMNEVAVERQLKVLANRRRLAIIYLLRRKRGLTVQDIADTIHLSLTATSRHLNMLERAGFLEKEQRSLEVFYRIAADPPAAYRALSHIF